VTGTDAVDFRRAGLHALVEADGLWIGERHGGIDAESSLQAAGARARADLDALGDLELVLDEGCTTLVWFVVLADVLEVDLVRAAGVGLGKRVAAKPIPPPFPPLSPR